MKTPTVFLAYDGARERLDRRPVVPVVLGQQQLDQLRKRLRLVRARGRGRREDGRDRFRDRVALEHARNHLAAVALDLVGLSRRS